MRVITIDIETTTEGYDEHDLIPEWPEERKGKPIADASTTREPLWSPRRKFPPLPLHKPEVICALVVDSVANAPTFEMLVFDAAVDDEQAFLKKLGVELTNADRLVTWNGRGFDMPLLNLRALKHGADWSFWEGKRHRFPNYKKPLFHFDMQDQLGDYGAARSISLDRTSKLIGLPGKVGIDGGGVAEAIANGDRRKVIAYCCNDVFETYLVYLAFCNSHLAPAHAAQVQRTIDKALAWAALHEYLGDFY